MSLLLIIFFGILGTIIGSFLNVAILRFNTGKGFGGRSMCFSCGAQLRAQNLIPALSFLFQRGRCHSCKSHISKQYITVELVTGLLFVVAYLHNATILGTTTLLFLIKMILDLSIMSLLIFIAGYDIKHKIIPDGAALIFACLALLSTLTTLIVDGFSFSSLGWVLLSGLCMAVPFYIAWFLSKGRLIGLGDAKLVIGFGLWLGIALGFTAIIFGFWIGAGIALLIYLLRPDISLIKKILLFGFLSIFTYLYVYKTFSFSATPYVFAVATSLLCILLSKTDFIRRAVRRGSIPLLKMKTEVPFAPFLIAGLLIVYLFRYNIFASLVTDFLRF